jgi:hypothetical protein
VCLTSISHTSPLDNPSVAAQREGGGGVTLLGGGGGGGGGGGAGDGDVHPAQVLSLLAALVPKYKY